MSAQQPTGGRSRGQARGRARRRLDELTAMERPGPPGVKVPSFRASLLVRGRGVSQGRPGHVSDQPNSPPGLVSAQFTDPLSLRSAQITSPPGFPTAMFGGGNGALVSPSSHVPLPDDAWLDILKFMCMEDLCTVSLVSKYLNMVVNEPGLWKGVCPKRGKLDKEGLSQFFQDCENIIGRFKTLYLGGISGIKLTEDDFKVLSDHLKLEYNKITNVDFFSNDFTRIPPNLLAETLMELKIVSLRMVKLSPSQMLEIFLQISSKDPLILTELSLEGIDLSKCEPDLLATVISKLVKVNLTDTSLTNDQLVQILNHLKDSETLTLKELCLNLVNLSWVPANLLSKSVIKLELVELQDSNLSTNQCTQVLTEMLSSKTMKKLNMSENYNMRNIPRELRDAAQRKMPSLLQKTCAY